MMSCTIGSPALSVSLARATARPPAQALDQYWHVSQGDTTYGPYTGHELTRFARDGIIDRSTRVVLSGQQNWTTAGRDAVLAHIFCAVKVPLSPARLSQ